MPTFAVCFHRVLLAPPARVYQAFLNPLALAKWLPPQGFAGQVHTLEPQVGGAWRMSFTQLASGHSHSLGGHYLERVPDQLLRYDARFDEPGLPDTLVTQVVLKPVFCGTDVQVEQSGIPAEIPEAGCHVGWQQSVQLRALRVEGASDQ